MRDDLDARVSLGFAAGAKGGNGMFAVVVMYPPSSRFDLDYYLKTHMPLVQSRWGSMGLKHYTVLRGTGGPGGEPRNYQIVAVLNFEREGQFQEAAAQHGAEIMGDIPNFTDAQPTIQIYEAVG
jgi:uncharacterized protein (TIGR02118 family)